MNDQDDRGRKGPPESGRPEYPRSEPEIIPPDGGGGRGSRSNVWIWVADRDGMRRAPVGIPGPFTIFLVLALVGLVATVFLAVVLGALLFWIPVLVVVIGALLLVAMARQRWRRFQLWWANRR
jgi:hypothetical protein